MSSPIKMDVLPVQGEVIDTLTGDIQVGRKLGSGGFGHIFDATYEADCAKGESLVLKSEYYSKSQLHLELPVLLQARKDRNATRFCTLYGEGYVAHRYCYILMTKLGTDLNALRRSLPDQRFSSTTALELARQCLEALQQVHNLSFIHRDIKPNNFAPGIGPHHNSIYIFDFGLARKYVDTHGQHVAIRDGEVGYRGTTKYMSIRAHGKEDLSRRDDLESWLYMLIEFATGSLPWEEPARRNRRSKVLESKKECRSGEGRMKLLRDLPDSITEVLTHIESLEFDEEPKYSAMTEELEDRGGCDVFDWEKRGKEEGERRGAGRPKIDGTLSCWICGETGMGIVRLCKHLEEKKGKPTLKTEGRAVECLDCGYFLRYPAAAAKHPACCGEANWFVVKKAPEEPLPQFGSSPPKGWAKPVLIVQKPKEEKKLTNSQRARIEALEDFTCPN